MGSRDTTQIIPQYNMDKYIRTKKQGLYILNGLRGWGKFYTQAIEDPAGTATSAPKEFYIREDFPKLPAHMLTSWVKLCEHMIQVIPSTTQRKNISHGGGGYEVEALLLRKKPDLTEWRIIIPTQEVSAISVIANNSMWIDIFTGEEGTEYPPKDWAAVGTFHSHQSMVAFWSATDDNSELTWPGLHCTFGKINGNGDYQIAASIVAKGKRYVIDFENVAEVDYLPNVGFHHKVLDYIGLETVDELKVTTEVGYLERRQPFYDPYEGLEGYLDGLIDLECGHLPTELVEEIGDISIRLTRLSLYDPKVVKAIGSYIIQKEG